ncbi:alpha-endosulfine [Musca vetustissima]|uniref:alpha-endosulfine n=1 Tax=Musca vetustissima TaxID=27455 RepID=UPI002AB60216|nr:alpha-endosulfine [Musca vetustissima]
MSSTEETSSQATTPQDGPEEPQSNARELEKIEEEKLKSKYPVGLRGPGGHTAFLQKRLQKGQKYFDSGDYQMAKQKGGGIKQVFANKNTTGEAIPTPETVPARKTSIIQPCNKFPATS